MYNGPRGRLEMFAYLTGSGNKWKGMIYWWTRDPPKRDSISGFEITNPQFAKTGQQMSSADVTLDKKIAKHGGSKSNGRYRRPNSSNSLT